MSTLYDGLQKTFGSPTMAPHCPDDKKYGVVEEIVAAYTAAKARGEKIMGLPIRDLVTILESLSDAAETTKDVDLLVEHDAELVAAREAAE